MAAAYSSGVDERRIRVVEDERTIADSVAARLRAEGFTVQIAADGPAGVEAFARGRPDLVVLDVMRPASAAWRCAGGSRPTGRSRCSC